MYIILFDNEEPLFDDNGEIKIFEDFNSACSFLSSIKPQTINYNDFEIVEVVKCGWCNKLRPIDECRYEIGLKWLCPHCEQALKSRGEILTFQDTIKYF